MSNISVIIPHYNSGLDVKRAYESVLNQTLLPAEIIIIDDCSLDKSILIAIADNHNYTIIDLKMIFLEKNSGPSFARNLGVRSTKSDYIAFLDSDDVWLPNKLEIQYKIMLDKNLKFSFHLYSAFPVNSLLKESSLKKISLYSLAKKQIICTPTVMLEKKFFQEFDEDLRYCEDFLCWVMTNNSNYFYMIDGVFSNGFKRQYGDSGLSANLKEMHKGFLQVCYILWLKGYWKWWCFMYFVVLEYIKYPLRLSKSKSKSKSK